jgi:hypothetical protein
MYELRHGERSVVCPVAWTVPVVFRRQRRAIVRPRHQLMLVASVFAVVTLLASPAPAQNYGSETGELSITPGELTVAIAGDGFNPDSTVLVRLGVNGEGEEIGTLRADENGAIEGEFTVPVADAEVKVLVAIGQTEDGATLTLSGSVGVGVGGEIPDLEPDDGSAGTDGEGEPGDGSDEDTSGAADDGAEGQADRGGGGTSALTVVLLIAVIVLAAALAAVLFACRSMVPILGGKRSDADDAPDADVTSAYWFVSSRGKWVWRELVLDEADDDTTTDDTVTNDDLFD